MHEGAGHREALLVAERQVLALASARHAELEFFQRPVHPLALARAREVVGAAEEAQVLEDTEVAVERELLGHVADPGPAPRRGVPQVEARDAQGARRGGKQAAEHPEGGGLCPRRWPQEAEDLAAADVKGRRRSRRRSSPNRRLTSRTSITGPSPVRRRSRRGSGGRASAAPVGSPASAAGPRSVLEAGLRGLGRGASQPGSERGRAGRRRSA